jgi:hypothetical protein
MPVRAACPCDSTHIGWPVWNAADMPASAATPVFMWQLRQNVSVLWHDWQSPAPEKTSAAWRSTKFGRWNARESEPA